MPVTVLEEPLDLAIGPVAAHEPVPDCQGLPRLSPAGEVEVRTFVAVHLENPFLRITVLPDLGGRIASILYKPTDEEILHRPAALVPELGGRRGTWLRQGLEITLDGEERPNSMGLVAYQLDPPTTDDDPAGVWLAESSFHFGLGFHALITLAADRPEFRVEVRTQNRTLSSRPYDAGLLVWGEPTGTLRFTTESAALDGFRSEHGGAWRTRFGKSASLGPRQTDSFAVRIEVFPGRVVAANGVGVSLGGDTVRASATVETPGKLLLLDAAGKTFEAPVTLSPTPTIIEVAGFASPAVDLALLDADGYERVRWQGGPVDEEPRQASVVATRAELDSAATLANLRQAAFDPASRVAAHVAIAQRTQRDEDWEAALLYNGDDALAWWAKAVAGRLAGNVEERPELLNAHFLAPLEPALRAEAFLSQNPEMGREANPIVAPLAEIPEDLVEAACLLVEHGWPDQAHRWIDEAVRHRNLAMLRYLMADILLQGTRMDTEAAEQVRAARTGLLPPLPWRQIELAAIRRLAVRFPHDDALQNLSLYVENLA